MRAFVARWNGVTGHALPPADRGDRRSADAQRVEHLALAEIVKSSETGANPRGRLDEDGRATDSVFQPEAYEE